MNTQNRKDLNKVIDLMQEAKEIIESVASEEQEKFDNMTEGLQQTERGQRMEEVAYELGNQSSLIEDIIYEIEGLKN